MPFPHQHYILHSRIHSYCCRSVRLQPKNIEQLQQYAFVRPHRAHILLPTRSRRMESEEDMWRLPYYHGVLSKANTERMLTKDGDFLIRLGCNTTSDDAGRKQPIFVLSVNVSSNAEVIHVIIRQRNGMVAVDFGCDKCFKTVRQFVDTHLRNGDSIAKDEHVVLRRPITIHHLIPGPEEPAPSTIGPLVKEEVRVPKAPSMDNFYTNVILSSRRCPVPAGHQINVNDELWVHTLAWVGRAELSTKFALINAAFDTMVDIQLGNRCWWLADLNIYRANDGTGTAEVHSYEDSTYYTILPIASTPLLDGVAGFKSITICYIDKSVIAFLDLIRRLLIQDVVLEISIPLTENRSWAVMTRWIWPLVQNGISTLLNVRKADVAMLRKFVTPTVLLDCVNLRRIHAYFVPKCPIVGDNNDDGDPLHVCRDLYIWIHSPRDDAQFVVLRILQWRQQWEQFVNSLFKSLEDASYTVNYLIFTEVHAVYTNVVHLDNFLTKEQIDLSSITKRVYNIDMSQVAVKRSPMEQTDQQFRDWTIYANQQVNKLVHITFGDANIGPLPPDDDDGSHINDGS